MTEAERLRRLEAVCLADMVALAGLAERPVGARVLRMVLGGGVRRFARDVAGFDRAVGLLGVAEASRRLAGRYGARIEAIGTRHIPPDGPLLLVANHPGLFDALAVYATAPRTGPREGRAARGESATAARVEAREDLLTLTRPQPMLRLLPQIGRHLLMAPEERSTRAGMVRATLRHLDGGGALLIFPAGHLEPDPAVPDGELPLGSWSPALGRLVRLAAESGAPPRIVPTAISGVLARTTRRRFAPLIRLRGTPRGRADLAALLQLAVPRLGATTIVVAYGEPLDATALLAAAPGPTALTEQIRAAVQRRLMTRG